MNTCKRLLAAFLVVLVMAGVIPDTVSAEAYYGADYSQLELLIGTYNGLNSYEFTKESWGPLQSAVDLGNRYLKGKYGQWAVDDAVIMIEKAMLGLVKMDYSALEATLAAVYSKIGEEPELHDAWKKLDAAVEEARPLLVSGDQEAVDAAVEQLDTLMEELEACLDTKAEPEVVIQEVEVEVPPTREFCNIPMHRLWPVLCIVSLCANVGLAIGLVYVLVKKRNTYDNTPLVSYDIEDDMEL